MAARSRSPRRKAKDEDAPGGTLDEQYATALAVEAEEAAAEEAKALTANPGAAGSVNAAMSPGGCMGQQPMMPNATPMGNINGMGMGGMSGMAGMNGMGIGGMPGMSGMNGMSMGGMAMGGMGVGGGMPGMMGMGGMGMGGMGAGGFGMGGMPVTGMGMMPGAMCGMPMGAVGMMGGMPGMMAGGMGGMGAMPGMMGMGAMPGMMGMGGMAAMPTMMPMQPCAGVETEQTSKAREEALVSAMSQKIQAAASSLSTSGTSEGAVSSIAGLSKSNPLHPAYRPEGTEPILGITNRRFEGTIRMFLDSEGYGFIKSTEFEKLWEGTGRPKNDVFFHRNQKVHFNKGDRVSFSVYLNFKGKPQGTDFRKPEEDKDLERS